MVPTVDVQRVDRRRLSHALDRPNRRLLRRDSHVRAVGQQRAQLVLRGRKDRPGAHLARALEQRLRQDVLAGLHVDVLARLAQHPVVGAYPVCRWVLAGNYGHVVHVGHRRHHRLPDTVEALLRQCHQVRRFAGLYVLGIISVNGDNYDCLRHGVAPSNQIGHQPRRLPDRILT